MRRKLLGLMGVALTIASLFSLTRSGAALTYQEANPIIGGAKPQSISLPEFDIRLADKGEFQDYDLSSAEGTQSALQNIAKPGVVSAVNQFRAISGSAQNLRAVVNETGAMKDVFIDGAPLSSPQAGTPDTIARNFLEQHSSLFQLAAAEVANLQLVKEDLDEGTTFLSYVQRIGGVEVFEGDVQVVVSKNGEVLSVREGFLLDGQTVNLNSGLTELQALAKAFEHAGRDIEGVFTETQTRATRGDTSVYANPLGSNYENVLSELVVLRVGDSARLAWQVYADVGPNEWYLILLDAETGELLFRHNLYVFEAQGTVYTVHPDFGARQLLSFVGNTTINTAAGWMGTSTMTTGNNVQAYLDTDANNAPDPNNSSGLSNGHALSSTQNFTFPFSTAVDPRTQQAAVVTNLFYFNNVMHDFSYGLGFTETAGNFQTNNFGRGGLGNDSVVAEAQDGSGTNNANFGTPPDGQRPRMQQYLFTSPNPDRDSSVDSDVVFHEYGHGVSTRLIGNGGTGLTGQQSGAMGEGWSDYWSITINNDGVMGEYVANNANGGRRAPYTVPAATVHDSYADVGAGGFEVHRDGEVWAATLWDLRTQLGKTITDRIVLNGMKFTPVRPSFLNARDGILQADQNLNAGANRCAIWTVFARHGMGFSAVGNDGTTHVAATNLPTDCGGCTSAQMTSPANGSTIQPTTTFNWNTGSGSAEFWLYVGTSVGGNNVYSASQGTGTSRSLSNLPAGIIYVRVWSRCGATNVWSFNDYSFTVAANCSLAQMTSPANGSSIQPTTTFNWNTGTGNVEYWLYAGTSAGGNNIYSASQGSSTSRTLSNLPGGTIYVRVWSRCGATNVWSFNDYSFTVAASCSLAQMTSPSNGSNIQPTTTFGWTTGSGNAEYWLYVGTSAGGNNIYSVSQGTGTSRTLNNLPGGTIYVRLWSRCGATNVWSFIDYSFTGAANCSLAQMTSPANGSNIQPTTTFNWNTGSGNVEYWLYAGSSAGGNNLYSASQGTGTSRTLSNLPGGTIYVRLWSRCGATNVWSFNDYSFTGAANCSVAQMTSPTNGSAISSTTTFNWNTGTGNVEYWLYAGTTAGGNDLYSASQGTGTSRTLNNLPGGTIYVRLWSRCGATNVWSFVDYSFAVGCTSAQMTSPANGSSIQPTTTFSWNTGNGNVEYWLYLGTTVGGANLYSASQGTGTSRTLSNLPGGTLYVRLWSRCGATNVWSFIDYSFTVSGGSAWLYGYRETRWIFWPGLQALLGTQRLVLRSQHYAGT